MRVSASLLENSQVSAIFADRGCRVVSATGLHGR
jgi:hypothetical protein